MSPACRPCCSSSSRRTRVGGIAALAFLANHPATHRFLATKLVRHFVADDPPPDACAGSKRCCAIPVAILALPRPPWCSSMPPGSPDTKLRTPMEYVIASVRALDVAPDQMPLAGILAGLGQPLWTAPAPNGWPDSAADWAAPEAMLRRIDWASGFAGRVGDRDVMQIADATLGPLLRPETRDTIRRAGSRREAMTLLLTCPEFQRR